MLKHRQVMVCGPYQDADEFPLTPLPILSPYSGMFCQHGKQTIGQQPHMQMTPLVAMDTALDEITAEAAQEALKDSFRAECG